MTDVRHSTHQIHPPLLGCTLGAGKSGSILGPAVSWVVNADESKLIGWFSRRSSI